MSPDAEAAHEARRQQLLLRVLWRAADPAALAPWLHQAAPGTARGLLPYRAHAHVLAPRALAAVYPTLQQLLGEASFAALARAHWQHAPPERGDLAHWGERLPAFVAAAPDLAGVHYLADLARLEWAVHGASMAADVTAAPMGLDALALGDASLLRVLPTAGTVLVESTHPIVSIWQAHDDARPQLTTVHWAAARVEPALVWRSGWRVQVAALAADEATCTRQVMNGAPLAMALEAAQAVNADFDFQAWLLLQLQRGWLAGAAPA